MNWYIARVRMNTERQVAKRLSLLGFETFVPTQIEIHQWKDRRKKVERLLIPPFVFVKAEANQPQELKNNYTFIYDWMSAPGERKPAIVPDYQIERLKFMLGNADSEVKMEYHPLQKGDQVRIIRGNLMGLIGNVVTDVDGKSMLSITIDYLGCASVKINLSDVELMA